jgi:hypothetical protein
MRIGEMPAIRGTGALRYSLRVIGRIGISTCSHLKGKSSDKNPSTA